MTSVRAAAGQYLRIQAPLTLRSVGTELGRPTGSTKDLVARLEQWQARWFSGSLLPSSVKGSAYLDFWSDGFYRFHGHVHENGFWGHAWSFVAGPNMLDDDGKAFVFSANGHVTDEHSSDDFDILGHDPRIAKYWDRLAASNVTFKLAVNITVGDVISGVLKIIGTAVGVAAAIAAIHFVGGKGKMRVYTDSQGVDHVYREWE